MADTASPDPGVKPKDSEMTPSTEEDAARLAAVWASSGIGTTDLQLFAASRDFAASKRLEVLAEIVRRKHNGGSGIRHSDASNADGRAKIRLAMDLEMKASKLRESGVTHSAQRDILVANGLGQGETKEGDAEVTDAKDEAPPSRIEQMRRKRASG